MFCFYSIESEKGVFRKKKEKTQKLDAPLRLLFDARGARGRRQHVLLFVIEISAHLQLQTRGQVPSHGDRGSDDAKKYRRRADRHRRRGLACRLPARGRGQGLPPRRGERE